MEKWLDKFQNGGSKPDLQQHKSVPSNDRLNYQKPVVQDFVYDSNGKLITDSTVARATLRLRTNEQGNISKTVPRSKLKNAYDVAVHPFTSAQQLLANQPVTGRGPQNIYDFSLDAFPAILAAKQLPQIPGNIQRGEYTQAGLNALTVLPFLPKIPKSIPKVFSEGQPYEGAPHIYTDYYPVNNVYQPRTVITDANVKNDILGLESTPVVPINPMSYPETPNRFLYGNPSSFGRMEQGVVDNGSKTTQQSIFRKMGIDINKIDKDKNLFKNRFSNSTSKGLSLNAITNPNDYSPIGINVDRYSDPLHYDKLWYNTDLADYGNNSLHPDIIKDRSLGVANLMNNNYHKIYPQVNIPGLKSYPVFTPDQFPKNKFGGSIIEGAITNTGYKNDSKDRYNDYNIIPSNNITMKNVNHPIVGIDNTGHTKYMQPGNDYKFPGQYVTEFPVMQNGGVKKNTRNWLEYLND